MRRLVKTGIEGPTRESAKGFGTSSPSPSVELLAEPQPLMLYIAAHLFNTDVNNLIVILLKLSESIV